MDCQCRGGHRISRQRISVLKGEQSEAQREVKALEPKLPACVLLSIVGQLRKRTGEHAVYVMPSGRAPERNFPGSDGQGAQRRDSSLPLGLENFLQIWRLGHGGQQREVLPRLIEALTGKKVIGASAGRGHNAAWTDAGELFTFGNRANGRLGHGGQAVGLVPRLVEACARKCESR